MLFVDSIVASLILQSTEELEDLMFSDNLTKRLLDNKISIARSTSLYHSSVWKI